MTLRTVLLSIQALLESPEPDDPQVIYSEFDPQTPRDFILDS